MPEELEKSGEEAEKTEEAEEESPEETTSPETESMGALFSPEGVIMMFLAGILDLIGLIILCFGLDDCGILDIIGLILIGGWMLSRYGRITVSKGAKKIGSKMLKQVGLSFLGELIPYFGNIAPCWTLAVYFQIKSK